MRRSARAILAILSLALLPVLLSAYAVNCGFEIEHINTSRRYRGCGLDVGTGLIAFEYAAGVSSGTIPAGWRDQIYLEPRVSFHHIEENLWTFQFAPIAPSTVRLLSFPAWLPALLCTIAPLLWLRRRRAITPRGFALEPPATADAPARQE